MLWVEAHEKFGCFHCKKDFLLHAFCHDSVMIVQFLPLNFSFWALAQVCACEEWKYRSGLVPER